MRVQLLDNQRMIDIAMQELGDVERIFEIAIMNGSSITDDFAPGDVLEVPLYNSAQVGIISVLKATSLKPASAFDELLNTIPPGGIGYMKIERDFIAS